MKLVTAVIKPHKWEEVRAALEALGITGIDLVVHAETAYDLHATAGARSAGHGLLGAITQHQPGGKP